MEWKNQCARYCAFFPYYLIVCIIFIAVIFPLRTYTTDIIKVNSDYPKFNSSEDPTIVLHVTDIHISDYWPDSIVRLRRDLNISVNQLKPTFTLLSGDMVDTYSAHDVPAYTNQQESQWQQYNDTIYASQIKFDELFELFGNHDLYGLYEFIDNVSLPSKYTRIGKAVSYSKERNDLRIVAFNPQSYPSGHGPQNFNPPLYKHMVDALEDELAKPTNCKYTIVTCHYTHELLVPKSVKSKNGHTFEELLKMHKPIAFMNGHTHPAKAETVHYADTMELTGTATKEFDDISILSIDNGRVHYYTLDPTKVKGPYAMVTNPAPQQYAVYNFPDTEFPIRIVSFDPSKNKNFEISGDFTGKLAFERYLPNTNEQVALYSVNAKFDKGIHTINVTGDLEQSITFAVNTESGPFKEYHTIMYSPIAGVIGFPLIFILFTVIVIFMWIPLSAFDSSANYIVGKGSERNWWLIILAGPITYGRCLAGMEIWIKIFVTFSVISNLFMPICFYKLEGRVSVFWLYGYITNGRHVTDYFSTFVMTWCFICFIAWIVLAGSVYMTIKNAGWSKCSWFFLIDLFATVFLMGIGWKFLVLHYVRDIGYKFDYAASFPYIIYPVLAVLLYLITALFWKKTDANVSDQESEKSESDSGTGVDV